MRKLKTLDFSSLVGQPDEELKSRLASDPSLLRMVDSLGWHLIHHLAEAGNEAGLQVMLDEGIDVNLTEAHRQQTPLHVAVSSGSVPCVSLLIDAGANVNQCRHFGETPLFDASTAEMIECLCDAGATSNLRNDRGEAVLRYSAMRLVSAESIWYWLDHGHDPNERDGLGRTPLFGLFQFGFDAKNDDERARCIELLLNAGANPSVTDKAGRTILHDAAWHSHHDQRFLRQVLEHGADPNVADRDGTTPLMIAARRESMSLIECFLTFGANPNIHNRAHKYAYQFASPACDVHQRLQEVTQEQPKPVTQIDKVIDRLLSLPHYAGVEPQGCNDVELSELQAIIGHPLPNSYRSFLQRLGKGVGDFMACDHFEFQIDFVQRTCLQRQKTPERFHGLPADAVIIASRLGEWVVFYRTGDQGTEPSVYAAEANEDESGNPVFAIQSSENSSISDFFDDRVHEHESWFRSDVD